MRNDERKDQEKQLIEEAKAYFEKHGLNEAFDKFFERNDVARKMQGAYNRIERNLSKITQELESFECSPALKARALEVIKDVSGKKEKLDANIKITLMGTMFSLFEAMEQWICVDDQVLAPFKEAMVIERGGHMISTFHSLCENCVDTVLAKTFKLIFDDMDQEEGAKELMMRMIELAE